MSTWLSFINLHHLLQTVFKLTILKSLSTISFHVIFVLPKENSATSSSRMRVIYHNWSAMKQRLHPQSVAEISHHSVLSRDRIQQCETSTRTQITVCKSPFPSAGTAVSLFHAKTVQQRPLLPKEVETWLPDCGVAHYARIDHLSRLPVMPPSTFDVNWLQVQPQRLPGCQS